MLTNRKIAIVGSREFGNYLQLKREIEGLYIEGDWLVSGGAKGADSMAQRLAKEKGLPIIIFYPNWKGKEGRGAGFLRNKQIVENSDMVLAFYQKGRFQEGGTANTISWCRKLNRPFTEYEEE